MIAVEFLLVICANQLAAGLWPKLLFSQSAVVLLNAELSVLGLFLCTFLLRYTPIPFYVWNTLGFLIAQIMYYTYRFRGIPATILDIGATGTALSAIGGYTLLPFTFGWMGLLLVLLANILVSKVKQKKTKPFYTAASAVMAVLLTVTGISTSMKTNIMPDARLYRKMEVLGSVYTFFDDVKQMRIPKPENADDPALLAVLAEEPAGDAEFKPNILVVMNESLYDFSVAATIDVNQDYFPFWRRASSMENVKTGYCAVPVYGGYTCNTEYEFLTNFSMLFNPKTASPYMSMIHRPIYALPQHLKQLGYHTTAIHPKDRKNWNRDKVYPLLGFDTFKAIEDQPKTHYPVRFTSDRDLYDWALSELQKEDAARFVFTVTMQNHGGYRDGYTGSITTTGQEAYREELDEFLSLMYESDLALSYLVERIGEIEAPTVLLVFGDHAPAFASGVAGKATDDPCLMKTPYLLYANFPYETTVGEETSANYLNLAVMEAAGLPLSPFQTYVAELQPQKPVVSVLSDRQDPMLHGYWVLQYAQMKK